jgi:type III secretory pathway component EscV
MGTDHVHNDYPRITLDLELDPSLAHQLDLDELQDAVSQDLGEMLHVLGVPGEPLVQIKTAQEATGRAEWFLSVSINGQLCRFASELLRHVYHYVADEDLEDIATSARVLESLRELSPEQVGAFVRLTCAEIIKRSPVVLLTADAAAAYQEALVHGFHDADLPDVQWLQPILTGVLNWRIAIADQTTVAQVLKDGLAQGRSQAVITEDLIAALRPKAIEIHLPLAYLKEITLNTTESDRGNFAMMRDGLFYEIGARYPSIRFVPSEGLKSHSFRVKINHLTTLPWQGLRADECLVNDTPDRLGLLRIKGRAAINPANLSACAIIHAKDANLAEEAGLTTWNQIGYLVLALSAELRAYAACFLDREEVETYLGDLELAFPQLIEAARARVSPELMTQTLRLLLAEEISIRDLRQILQAMIHLDYDGPKYTVFDPRLEEYRRPEDEWFSDPVNLVSLVRITMKRYIGHKYARGGNVLVVFLLDPEIEALLANPQMMAADAYLARLEPRDRDRILAAVRAELGSLPPTAQLPMVLTTCSVRPIFRGLIAPELPRMAAMCYQELSPDMNIQPIARNGLS